MSTASTYQEPIEEVTDSPDGGPCETDADCSNGLVCDGEEKCVDGECQPGEEPECDDEDSCTMDDCDEDEGGCVNEPLDEDGDHYFAEEGPDGEDCGGTDCLDDNDDAHPGAPIKECSALDDDCYGTADCPPENTNEACSDGIDNDGDDRIDCADNTCYRSVTVTVCED